MRAIGMALLTAAGVIFGGGVVGGIVIALCGQAVARLLCRHFGEGAVADDWARAVIRGVLANRNSYERIKLLQAAYEETVGAATAPEPRQPEHFH